MSSNRQRSNSSSSSSLPPNARSNFPPKTHRLENLFNTLSFRRKRDSGGKEITNIKLVSHSSTDVGRLEEANKENDPSEENVLKHSGVDGALATTSPRIFPGTNNSHRLALRETGSNLLNCEQDKENTPAESVARPSQEEKFQSVQQTVFQFSQRIIDADMMDSKKPIQAPPNPPPPIPSHKLQFNGTTTPASPVNGIPTPVNGFQKPALNGTPKIEPLNGHATENKPYTNGALKSSLKETGSNKNVPVLKLNGFVGFDSLPYQLVKKCQSHGFQFNLLCVGETGMGKTTLIESLFNMKAESPPCNSELKTVELRTQTTEVAEGNVRVKLRIVETAGFGDQLDKEKSAKVIVDYINTQFEAYLKEELKIRRCLAYYDDTRIHACLYFISPTGHGLKALDVVTMRELAKRVNVIPVIAKSDTTCKDELSRFKQKILSELKANNIEIYQFPTDDETVRKENSALNALIPFAIVGSTDFVTKEDGKTVRARRYPWGIVEVENEEHCDFVKLREALLRINVDALRERTHNALYEAYRRDRLKEMNMKDGDCGPKMMEAFQQVEFDPKRQQEFKDEMECREKDFEKQFIERVNAKEEELKRREEMLTMRHKDIEDKFQDEFRKLESHINTLIEEKARLEGRLTERGNGKKPRK